MVTKVRGPRRYRSCPSCGDRVSTVEVPADHLRKLQQAQGMLSLCRAALEAIKEAP